MEYLRAASLSLLIPPRVRRVLIIGLGAGSFARLVRRHVPTARVDGVEIDPMVVDVAKRFFALEEGPRLRVHVQDGARFVRASKKRYDVVLLDAYAGDDIPPHLATATFFTEVRARLTSDGVAVLNLALEDDDESARVAARFVASFPGCARVVEPESGNTLLFGARRKHALTKARLGSLAQERGSRLKLPFSLEAYAAIAERCPAAPAP